MIRSATVFLDAPRSIRRALVLWALGRVAIMVVGKSPAVMLPFGSAVLVVAFVAVLCHIDARAMREQLFFANLGRSVWAPAAVGLAVASTFEVLLAALAFVVLAIA